MVLTKGRGFRKTALKILLPLLAALTAGTYYYTQVLSVGNVKGVSMMPALNNGERVIFQKRFFSPQMGEIYLVDHAEAPEHKNGEVKNLIKRVVAGPGDTLSFNSQTGEWLTLNGENISVNLIDTQKALVLTSQGGESKGEQVSLYLGVNLINGVSVYKVDESSLLGTLKKEKLKKELLNFPFLRKAADKNNVAVVIVPKDHYFVMSDNWSGNVDSRYFGPVHKSNLVAKMISTVKNGV